MSMLPRRSWPPRTLATLPSKQGLKQLIENQNILKGVTLATLPSKQGLKRKTLGVGTHRDCPTLATLPSKQGLKQPR